VKLAEKIMLKCSTTRGTLRPVTSATY